MKSVRNILSTALAALAFASVGATQATILFLPGNNPQPDEVNILFGDGPGPLIEQGTTITGAIGNTGLTAFFTGLETLFAPASGQARVEALDGSFTSLTMGVVNGTFHDFILNPNIFGTGQDQVGTITVTVDQVVGDDAILVYAVGPGNNFLTVLAIDGQRINSINITSTVPLSFLDLRQPRISGAFACPQGSTDPLCTGVPAGQVPEPSVLSLLGLGVLAFGAAGLRRRKPQLV